MTHSFRMRTVFAVALSAALAGCSILPNISLSSIFGGAEKVKPAELAPNPSLIAVRPAWTARIGQVNLPLTVNTSAGSIVVASGDGTVAVIDPATGRDVWRASAGAPLAAAARRRPPPTPPTRATAPTARSASARASLLRV